MTHGTGSATDAGALATLAHAAWVARDHARILGKTKVGCAARSTSGRIWLGCNVEHKYRSHDIHAEVNAIGSLVAGGDEGLETIFIAAERERFTPCGSCMDWIFELGGDSCIVAAQSSPDGQILVLSARELMPFYPI
ncbi:cytidine deaminase family protein [Agromyces sp. NPDC055657]